MSDGPKIKAMVPGFGSKRTMASDIVVELGPHRSYFEPFCLSAAVLFAKPVVSHETINDLHGDVINLARVLASPSLSRELYERARATLLHEDLHRKARERLVASGDYQGTEPCVARALDFLIVSWMGRNGEVGLPYSKRSANICVRWTPNGGAPAVRWLNTVESLPWWHERLRRVTILRRNAFEIIPRIADDTGVAIYCDPPYVEKSDSYLYDFQSSRGHDFAPGMFPEDCGVCGKTREEHVDHHAQLAQLLGRFKRARVVVSYYDHPRIRELYDGWTIVEHTRHKHLHVQNKRGAGKKAAPEILILNGLSYVEKP